MNEIEFETRFRQYLDRRNGSSQQLEEDARNKLKNRYTELIKVATQN